MGIKHLILFCSTSLLLSCQPASKPFVWNLPEGFPVPIVPSDNPMTEEKVSLGRALFYDKGLSGNQTLSCADCHQQAFAFAEKRQLPQGATGQVIRRNSLALVNVAYNGNLTWAHQGLNTIEQQILIPMFSEAPIEMGITGNEQTILERLNQGQYADLAQHAFDKGELDFNMINQALASFVRSLLSFNSAFDRYAYQQDDNAMSESAIRGLNLFFSERLECFHCHGGFNFTQSSKHNEQQLDLASFHNIGLYNEDGKGAYPQNDQGLIELSGRAKDMGRFRAPTLRNIEVTAPYMHDGSIETLEEVIETYVNGGRNEGINSPHKSQFIKGFQLDEQEKQDLLNFLLSLTDKEFLINPKFAAPDVKDDIDK